MIDYSTLGLLPDTYPRTIVLKARPYDQGGALPAAVLSESALGEVVSQSGGLAHLAQLDRAGAVRGVFAVNSPSATGIQETSRGAGALSVLANQAFEANAATASIVQFTADVDVDGLVDELGDDPQVDYASRVPARYAVGPAPENAMSQLEARVQQLEAAAAAPNGWNLTRIGLPQVEALGINDGRAIRVGILDTGVDDAHPELQYAIKEYVHGDTGAGPVSGTDILGHGTHVAGTVNSLANRTYGTRGICNAELHVWKIFDDDPDYIARAGLYSYLVHPVLYRKALGECAEKVDVVNLSIGGSAPPDPQEAALFKILADRGVTVVAAMGNERTLGSATSYPAAIPGVVAVGATSVTDTVAYFSNYGDHIALAAPGVSIWSTLPTYPGQMGFRASRGDRGQPIPGVPLSRATNYAAMDGTSMATPHVSAAAALTQANSPDRRPPQEIRDLLMATAARVPAMQGSRWNRDLGTGLLDLRRLMLAAQRL